MTEIMQPNLLGAVAQGRQLRAQEEGMRARSGLRDAVTRYGPTSPQAMNALGRVDPTAAMELGVAQEGELEKRRREAAQGLVGAVLDAPEPQRPQAWAAALDQAEAMGLDLTGVPQDYPGEGGLRAISGLLGMGRAERTEFERLLETLPQEQREQAVAVRLGLVPGAEGAPTPRTGLGKVNADLNAGLITPEQAEAERARLERETGTSIRVNPETGEFEFATGGAELSSGTVKGLERKEFDSRDALARLDGIAEQVANNPDLLGGQTLMGNLERMGLEWAEYIGGEGTLNEEQAGRLVELTQLRGDVLDNLNRLIKEITGAAMTDSEAVRIGATVPGVEDSPTVFLAKLQGARKRLRAAVARYNMWRKGIIEGDSAPDAASLGDVERRMDARASELMQAVQDGEMTPQAAEAAFAQEFGV